MYMYVYVCFPCMYICALLAGLVPEEAKRGASLLGLDLQVSVDHPVDAQSLGPLEKLPVL